MNSNELFCIILIGFVLILWLILVIYVYEVGVI